MEAKRAALDPETEARRRKAVVGLGGKMAWEDGVEDALKKASQRSDDGWLVTLVRKLACSDKESALILAGNYPVESRYHRSAQV